MKIYLFFFAFTFFCILLNAQPPTLQWAKKFGGTGNDESNSVAVDASGNVYTAGRFNDNVDFDPGPGAYFMTANTGYDIFVSKLDAAGNFIWAKQFGASPTGNCNSITVDAVGNVYITGIFTTVANFISGPCIGTYTLAGNGQHDFFVTKLNSSGCCIWTKSFGSLGDDFAYSIAVDGSGNVYTTGTFQGPVDFDPGPGTYSLVCSFAVSSAFVSKLDASGNFVWAKNLGGLGCTDFAYSIAVDGSSNVFTTGYFAGTVDLDPGPGVYTVSSVGSADIFVSKLDVSGNFVWAKSMGGTNIDEAYSITVDGGGNVYTTGFFWATADFDPGLGTYTLTSAGNEDIFISKLDASGNFVWAKSFGEKYNDWGRSITLDIAGNVYTTGHFQDTCDFDPGVGTSNLISTGSYYCIFISKLDALGNFVWAEGMGGTDFDEGFSIAVDGSNNVYTTGYFGSTVDFDPGPGIYNLSSAGTFLTPDVFVHKMCQTSCPLEIKENIYLEKFNIYPNPNSGVFNLRIENEIENGEIILFNSVGQQIHEQKIKQGVNTISIGGLAKGFYNYIIKEDKKKLNIGKLTIEQ